MAAISFLGVNGNLLRQSLRLGLSVLITCAIAQHFQRITYLWYPLIAVIFVVDDQDDNSLRAARGRILGTMAGGLVTFVVHTILAAGTGIQHTGVIWIDENSLSLDLRGDRPEHQPGREETTYSQQRSSHLLVVRETIPTAP